MGVPMCAPVLLEFSGIYFEYKMAAVRQKKYLVLEKGL